MSRLRIVEIKHHFFIEHADGRFYWFKYEQRGDAESCLENLSYAWNNNPLEEGKDLIVNFVKDTEQCLTSGEHGRKGAQGT